MNIIKWEIIYLSKERKNAIIIFIIYTKKLFYETIVKRYIIFYERYQIVRFSPFSAWFFLKQNILKKIMI